MGSSSGGPNTLTLDLRTDGLTEEELITLRKLTNDVASYTSCVEHCRVELESAEFPRRRIVLLTSDPVRLWGVVCKTLFQDAGIGGLVVRQSEAYWRGESICDSLMIHRWNENSFVDEPFTSRVECQDCSGFYIRGELYPRCPYCERNAQD